MSEVTLRRATSEDLPDVLNILDGAALRVDVARLKGAIENTEVLLATAGTEPNERSLGVAVLDGDEITSIAVRRRRRDQRIGTKLVERAKRDRTKLFATFEPGVVPFWKSVGFDIEPVEAESRFRGVWHDTASRPVR